MRGTILLHVCLLVAMMITGSAIAEVYLVGHANAPDKSLETETVERIFLGKKSRWSDGSKIVPVMLKAGVVHAAFIKKILDRDVSQFSTYWKQAVFTGRGLPPKSFETEAELIDFVSSTPGAVGYVSRKPRTDSLRVITVK